MNMDFDFNKTSKGKTTNSTESKKSNEAKATEAPAEAVELTNNASEAQPNTAETKAEAKAEEKAEPKAEKVVVTYIGNGTWVDSKNKCWSRNENAKANILTSRSYSHDEYEEREDLKFMVRYGEMRLTLV
jgi:hypothetical protein